MRRTEIAFAPARNFSGFFLGLGVAPCICSGYPEERVTSEYHAGSSISLGTSIVNIHVHNLIGFQRCGWSHPSDSIKSDTFKSHGGHHHLLGDRLQSKDQFRSVSYCWRQVLGECCFTSSIIIQHVNSETNQTVLKLLEFKRKQPVCDCE